MILIDHLLQRLQGITLQRSDTLLQKWAYGAGLFTLLHYALLEGEFEDAITLFAPLIILQIVRIILEYKENQKKKRRKERRLKKKLA